MPVSIKEVIDTALRLLGVAQTTSGDEVSAAEYADGIKALRRMLDAWSLENLMIPYQVTERFPLSVSKNVYAMGPEGDWISVRPESVEFVRIEIAGTPWPLRRTTRSVEQFRGALQVGRPSSFMYQADGLHGYVELDAYPDGGEALVTSLKPFNVALLDDFDLAYDAAAAPTPLYPSGFTLSGILSEIHFPTGFEGAITAGLAVTLHPEYPGSALSPVVVATAAGLKTLIKRRNAQPLTLTYEPALLRRCGAYDMNVGPGG